MSRAPLPVMTWIHGYSMSSRIWQQVWPLVPGLDHDGIDLPLHGVATSVPMPAKLSALAGWVAERMELTGSRILHGMSFGSAVALQVALDHPERLDLLVLSAPTLAGMPDDRTAAAKYLAMADLYRRIGPGRALADLWMAAPPDIFTGLRSNIAEFERIATIVAQHPFRELADGSMAALARARQDPADLARVSMKVLVLSGDLDMPRFIDNASVIGRRCPHATVVVVPGAGHLPVLEAPEACATAIMEAVSSGPGRAHP